MRLAELIAAFLFKTREVQTKKIFEIQVYLCKQIKTARTVDVESASCAVTASQVSPPRKTQKNTQNDSKLRKTRKRCFREQSWCEGFSVKTVVVRLCDQSGEFAARSKRFHLKHHPARTSELLQPQYGPPLSHKLH